VAAFEKFVERIWASEVVLFEFCLIIGNLAMNFDFGLRRIERSFRIFVCLLNIEIIGRFFRVKTAKRASASFVEHNIVLIVAVWV
jgi:hypothetical protein